MREIGNTLSIFMVPRRLQQVKKVICFILSYHEHASVGHLLDKGYRSEFQKCNQISIPSLYYKLLIQNTTSYSSLSYPSIVFHILFNILLFISFLDGGGFHFCAPWCKEIDYVRKQFALTYRRGGTIRWWVLERKWKTSRIGSNNSWH